MPLLPRSLYESHAPKNDDTLFCTGTSKYLVSRLSKGTSDVGVLGKLHVVALVLGGQIAVHVNWPRDLARLVGTQPHVATTCYKTSIVSSRRSTRKDALSYFENCWAGWLCFLSRTLKRSTQMMATISTIRGLTTIKIFNVAPWTRTTTTATHYKHQPGTNQTTRKPYNKRFTRLKKMKLKLTRKPNNNKRLTHVQLKQIKTQSKSLLITTKPNKNVCLNHIWLLLWLYKWLIFLNLVFLWFSFFLSQN